MGSIIHTSLLGGMRGACTHHWSLCITLQRSRLLNVKLMDSVHALMPKVAKRTTQNFSRPIMKWSFVTDRIPQCVMRENSDMILGFTRSQGSHATRKPHQSSRSTKLRNIRFTLTQQYSARCFSYTVGHLLGWKLNDEWRLNGLAGALYSDNFPSLSLNKQRWEHMI